MQEKTKQDLTKSQQNASYKRHYACVLTKPEGATLDSIISDHGCNNLSQLCKKIVSGQITLY